MKKWLFLLLCSAWYLNGAAQNFRVSYFGENLTHYGIRAGMEQAFHSREKDRGNGLFSRQEWLLGLSLTVFRHPGNQLGVILAPELGWRHTGRRGGVLQLALAPGLFRSFLEAETYEPGDDGTLVKVPLAGRWGFLPGASVGYGRDLSARGGRPVVLFTNLHYMRQYPYNASFLNRFGLELGVIVKPE